VDPLRALTYLTQTPNLRLTRFPAHVHHPAKYTSALPNLFFTPPYFKNLLLNNHPINQLVIKDRDRLIVKELYYELVLALLKYLI
jgi:hypothetical protein